jgi:hypothetical protein
MTDNNEDYIYVMIKVPKKHIHFNFIADGITTLRWLRQNFEESYLHDTVRHIDKYMEDMKARQKFFIIAGDEATEIMRTQGEQPFLDADDMNIE